MRDLFLVAIACAGCSEFAATTPEHKAPAPTVHSPFVPVSPYAPGQPDPGTPDPSVPACDQRAFPGAPITTPANQWTWVDFPEALCRDGSSTGIGVRLNPNSNKVAIYLEGGG